MYNSTNNEQIFMKTNTGGIYEKLSSLYSSSLNQTKITDRLHEDYMQSVQISSVNSNIHYPRQKTEMALTPCGCTLSGVPEKVLNVVR
jgi:RNase P subunit RPR2